MNDRRHAGSSGASARAVRVLIADGDPSRLAEFRAAVEPNGRFSVCAEAADGAAAVQAAVRELPDVCLLDIGMAGGSIAATREITSRLPETRVVMIAASPDDDNLIGAVRAGAVGYVAGEAVSADGLLCVLHAVVRGEAAIPRALVAQLVDEIRDRSSRRRSVVSETGFDLTSREWEVLDLLRHGLSTRDIAERLFVSRATVRSHVAGVLRKLGLPDREALGVRDAG